MGFVIIIKYRLGVASVEMKKTHCKEEGKNVVSVKDTMERKFGMSPYKNWAKFKERNGGMR